MYPEESTQYQFCSTNNLVSSDSIDTDSLVVQMIPPRPQESTTIKNYFADVSTALTITEPLPKDSLVDEEAQYSLVRDYAKAATTISDAITMSLSSAVKGTDSIEEKKESLAGQVAKFAENMNEVVHKINFLFSSCKCVPGTDSVYCTPC